MVKSKRFRKSNPSSGPGQKRSSSGGKGKPGKNKRLQRRREEPSKYVQKETIKEEVEPNNPFEIRVNKRKHEVLGRLGRHEKGMPGVSRAKALEKRQSTLLQEYKVRNKSNLLIDRRIGEANKNMPEEDKLIKRAAMEKRRQYKKKSIFSLGDDDELFTHKGKPLLNVDRYEDPREQSDSEDELLSEAFVSDAHFGGGFLRVKKDDEVEMDEEGKPKKTRDEIIAELILASKQRKFEKAKETDENYEKIVDLDNEFKSLEFKNLLNQLQVPKKPKKDELTPEQLLASIRAEEPKPAPAPIAPKATEKTTAEDKVDYDRLVRELQFEVKRARPADIPKTDTQQVQDDLEELKSTLSEISDLDEPMKANLEKVLTTVIQAKGEEKLQLPDVLSTLIGFFLNQVEFGGSSGGKLSILSGAFKSLCDVILPHMNSLLAGNSVGCTKRFLEHIVQGRDQFKKKSGRPISAQTIALLQLCPKLFPTTDNRHWVISPAICFLSEAISQSRMPNIQAAFRVLHLSAVLYEFVQESKRYCPEVISFLWSILLCFTERTPDNINLMVPNVRKAQSYLSSERRNEVQSDIPEEVRDLMTDDSDSDLGEKNCGPSTQVQMDFLSFTLDLLVKFTKLYEYLPSSTEIFKPIVKTLEDVKGRIGDPKLVQKIDEVVEAMSNLKVEKQFLRIAAEKPKPLRLYEPLIQEGFDGSHRRKLPRQKQEEARLAHKVKKEFKSAVREIKKDSEFLARQQMREQMQSDAERKRKVKELMGSLANQEGDYQKLTKKKK